jgi:hypothetical protein
MGAKKKGFREIVGTNEAAAQAALKGFQAAAGTPPMVAVAAVGKKTKRAAQRHERLRRKPVSPAVAKRLAANKAKAEVRCMLCGHGVVMRAPSTSEVIRLLRDWCIREGWRTLLLPAGRLVAVRKRPGRRLYPRRLMVCKICHGRLRPVSRRVSAWMSIACETWGS